MKIIGIGIVAIVLFLVQKKIYSRVWNQKLKAKVAFEQSKLVEGEEGTLLEIIVNQKWLPLPMLKAQFQTSKYLEFVDDKETKTSDQYYRNDVFQIGGRERITRRLSFRAAHRGYYSVKQVDLLSTDLFYFEEYRDSMPVDTSLYVYPKIYAQKEFRTALHKLNGDILVKRHLLEDPFEYRGIREYQPFDDMRNVNWNATARTGALKVNQKNYTAMQTIRIFLNLEDTNVWKKYREMETSMQVMMGLVSYFLAQGIKVSCYANGRDVLTDEYMEITGGASSGQIDAVGRALARIDTKKEPYGFKELFGEKMFEEGGALMTFFISPNETEGFMDMLERCEREGISYTWFYPHTTIKAPEVPAIFKKNVQFLYIE
jgi:uncharacterized protein (DUF58 family)